MEGRTLDSRRTLEPGNVTTRGINVALGAWVFISAFIWTHTVAQFWNTWIVGALVALFALGAFRVPQARFLNAALAVWLFISIFALPTNLATAWNNGILAALIFIVSMIGVRMPTTIHRGAAHA